MLRQRRISQLCCAAVGIVGALGLLPGVASADTTITGTPSVTTNGAYQVGQPLTCDTSNVTLNDPSSDGSPTITDYSWYQDSTSGTEVYDSGDGSNDQYTPTASDIGHALVCQVTASDGTTPDATASSVASPAVLPVAAVTLTQYSGSVSGNIGETVSGVTVNLSLTRLGQQVATASATTDSTGAWSTTLAPSTDAFGAPDDQLDVSYSDASATVPASAAYPNQSVDFLGNGSTISPDGTTVSTPWGGGCSPVNVIVDGVSNPTTYDPASGDCQLTGQSLTDNNHVQAALTNQFTAADQTVSNLTSVSDVGLLGVGDSEGSGVGAPTCTADLVSGEVLCNGLNGGSFSVNGTPLDTYELYGGDGYSVYQGSAFLSGLASGDTVTLKESGISRALHVLHVGTLKVDIGSDASVTGTCTADKELLSYSSGSAVCPSSGQIPSDAIYGQAPSEFDDTGGGSTILNLPQIGNTIPSYDDTLMSSAWTSYADLFGVGDVQSEISSLTETITPHAGGSPVFDSNMTITSDSTGPFATVDVPALSAGRYFASWVLTDTHGDVNALPVGNGASSVLFAVEPGGGTGPQGPQGPQGPRGPQGPAGQSSKCVVTTKTVHRHKVQHITCHLISASVRFVSIEITRGRRTYAVGSSVVRGRRTSIRLHRLHALRRGRYLVTIVATRHGKATVTRYWARL